MSQPAAERTADHEPQPLTSGELFSALGALFTLTLRQHIRGRRLVLLCFLFLLPTFVAMLALNAGSYPPEAENLEFALIFSMLPHALIPLAALLYASGMIQDEIEDQTLTYLMIRPLPRRLLYLVKLLATVVLTILLTAIFTLITYVAIYAGAADFSEALLEKAPVAVFIFALGVTAYCSIFGCISLYTSRALVVGIAYVVIFEGVIANIPFAVREFTVMFYLRVLAIEWVGISSAEWDIGRATAPEPATCVGILLGVSVAAAALAAIAFANREFRVKTPEGN